MPTCFASRSLLLVRLRRVLAGLWLLVLAGCPDESPPADAVDLGLPSAADLGCYENPQTHVELINACTPAQSLAKQPTLPLLRADGTLPPLP